MSVFFVLYNGRSKINIDFSSRKEMVMYASLLLTDEDAQLENTNIESVKSDTAECIIH